MPASRPQNPEYRPTTTTIAFSTVQPLQPLQPLKDHQQQHRSIVSSPQSSPTNLPLDRFNSPSSLLSLTRPNEASLSVCENVTETAGRGDSAHHTAPDFNSVEALLSTASVPSATSEHPISNSRSIVALDGKAQQHQQQQQQQYRAQVQSQAQAQAQTKVQGHGHGRNASQMIALTEARLFTQQLHEQQQQQHHQHQGQQAYQPDIPRRSAAGERPQSITGPIMSARVSTAASAAGGPSHVFGSGGVHGDELTEQTLLLVRPVWVQDQDAAACCNCTRTFNAVRRKHHCRQCGRVFCHDCSARSIALPQLGYTKAVRVCNDCFEVAYLVAYCLSDDLGPSTQIHGARGLYDLIETNDEKATNSVLTHGGLDAAIYLCNMTHGYELHALATLSLAALAEYRDIQSVIVAKRAMPKLFHLVSAYAQHAIAPFRPPSPPMPLNRTIPTPSLHTKNIKQIETVAVILMNVTQIVLQMVPDRTLAKQLVNEGAVDSLMCLCVYFPTGIRTRALDDAIRAMSMDRNCLVDSSGDTAILRWKRAQEEGSIDSHSQPPLQKQLYQEGDEFEEGSLISMDDVFHAQLESMQGLAAKCMSIIAADVTNQAFIVDDPDRIDRLTQLLYSNNADVVKYACKTMAYLSLRNDRYKPDIVKGSGAAALLAVLQAAIGDHARSGGSELAEAISHACCALANLATNTESQEILMSHMELLSATCAVVGLFPNQREIERHVARLLANLALYDQNKLALLTAYSSPSDIASVDGYGDSQIGLKKHPHRSTTPIRFPSPPPPARRAKGNVIPTLVNIGAMTLERAYRAKDEEYRRPYQQHDQDAVDFMNDEGQELSSVDAGYLTPNDSSSEKDVSGRGYMQGYLADTCDREGDGETPEWVTVQGMEDVQRHIIRAIDNLMTSVTEDPSSSQSFKVFSRVWPTIGLIKTIQMSNQDEDTQRRAMHVLSTLIQLQEIHADAMAAFKQQTFAIEQSSQLDPHSTNSQQQQQCKDDKLEGAVHQKLGDNSAEAELAEEQAEKECLEKAKKGKMETERLDQGRLGKEGLEKEQLEQERLEKGHLKIEALEREGLEKEAVGIEGPGVSHDQERIKNEGKGQESYSQEKLELENPRLRREQACLDQTRLSHDQTEQVEEDEEASVSSASSLRVPSPKIVSGLEEPTASQDEESLPKEKTKRKKKKSSK